MNLRDISEIVTGLTLTGKLPIDAVNHTYLLPPFDEMIRMKKAGSSDAEIIQRCGYDPYKTSLLADEAIGTQDSYMLYIDLLQRTAINTEVGTKLTKMARDLSNGNDVPVVDLQAAIASLDDGLTAFMSLDEVEASSDVWRPTFIPAIDETFGGFVEDGMTILAAPPGTGKTTLLLRLAIETARNGREFGIVSLEMPAKLLKYRLLQLEPDLSDDIMSRIILTDSIMDYMEVYSAVGFLKAKHPDLYAIGIDYADLMIPTRQEESTEVAGIIYRTTYQAAKKMKVPILLLAQLNANYVGGIPRVNHIRFSRLAEATASSIWLLYNPRQIWIDMGETVKNNPLHYEEGKGYIILGKSRFGSIAGGIGAIRTNWKKELGWDFMEYDWIGLDG